MISLAEYKYEKFKRVLILPECYEDLQVYIYSGFFDNIYRLLRSRALYINERIDQADICRDGWVEKPSYEKAANMFKSPISGRQLNLRLILTFVRIGGVKYALFLHVFSEKVKHKDYNKALEIAQARYSKFKEKFRI